MRASAWARFLAFHAANPHVYRRLVVLALEALSAKREHFGIRLLWERLRWDVFVRTFDLHSDFKLNDHYHSYYGRLLENRNPQLRGLFEMRSSPADRYDYSAVLIDGERGEPPELPPDDGFRLTG